MSDKTATIKVRATQLGYYEHKRRREGDVFVLIPITDRYGNIITARQQFSKKWMEVVPAETPEKVSTMTKVTPGNLQEHLDKNMPIHPAPEQVRFEVETARKNQQPAPVAASSPQQAAENQNTSEEEVI